MQLGHLKGGYTWVHLKHEVMMFLVNKREQIWDDMVIHVNKSSLSYKDICKHYINASDHTPIADGTGNFIITGACLFLQLPIIIVKPTYVKISHNKVETNIHEYKCTKEDKNLDQSKCSIFMVYNGINYYAPCLPPALRDLYYRKGHTEAHITDVIAKVQDIQEVLPMSDVRATIDQALLHLRAASSLISTMEVTSGAGDVTVGKEAPVLWPNSSTHKRTCQNNVKPLTDAPNGNPGNVDKENGTGQQDTQHSGHNQTRDEAKTDGNHSSSNKKEGSDTQENGDTNDGAEKKIDPPKNSTVRKANQCWCSLVYDSNQDVKDHIKLDHANNSYICSECKQPLGTQQSMWSHFRKQHLGIYQYTCQELKKDSSGVKCGINRDELSEIRFHLETEHGKGRKDVQC